MSRSIRAFALVAALVLLAAPAGAQYQITQSVVASGGGSYGLLGTVGQPTIGVTSGGSYVKQIGFWYQPGWIVTGVEQETTPVRFQLDQNFPNPLNPVTTFRFGVPRESRVTIKLYDVAGREVRTLVDGTYGPGFHAVLLNARGLASGVYFCRMTSDTFAETRKLTLLK